jgi:hypothetical protein
MKLFAHLQPHRVIITFTADGTLDAWTEYDGLATGNEFVSSCAREQMNTLR